MIRWSSPSLRPSEVIFSMLSLRESTRPVWTSPARWDSSFTMACWIMVGLEATV